MAVTGRSLASAHEVALEDASREAWRRLDAFDDEEDSPHAASVRQFRAWWRLGVIQHLIASGRFRDLPREADAARPPDEDRAAAATLALLRGVALETRARLADEAPGGTVGITMRRQAMATPSRLGPLMLAMDEAGKSYRRALEFMPDDREAALRLGRVAIERNRLDDAERLLGPLVQSSCRDTTCGLAHLFMGEVHEARQDLERAVGAYARASSVQSVRPAALIAMIQATLRRGNVRGAYDLTRQFATPAALAPTPGAGCVEPVHRRPADRGGPYPRAPLRDGGQVTARAGFGVLRSAFCVRPLIAAAGTVLLLDASPRAQDPVPMFRASVDVVTVDAFAHKDRKPIGDLTAQDFIVRDNGVEQVVDSLGTTDSAHVIIGLDLSGSVDGKTLEQLRSAVRALVGELTPDDRVSLFTFSDRLRLLMRARPSGATSTPRWRSSRPAAPRPCTTRSSSAARSRSPTSARRCSCSSPTARTRPAGHRPRAPSTYSDAPTSSCSRWAPGSRRRSRRRRWPSRSPARRGWRRRSATGSACCSRSPR